MHIHQTAPLSMRRCFLYACCRSASHRQTWRVMRTRIAHARRLHPLYSKKKSTLDGCPYRCTTGICRWQYDTAGRRSASHRQTSRVMRTRITHARRLHPLYSKKKSTLDGCPYRCTTGICRWQYGTAGRRSASHRQTSRVMRTRTAHARRLHPLYSTKKSTLDGCFSFWSR